MSKDKEKHYYCCCFRTITGLVAFCVGIVLLIIGIGLAIFFLYPRNLSFWISAPPNSSGISNVLVKTNESNAIVGLLAASASNPFSIELNASFLLSVYSPNYYDIYANQVKTNVSCFV
jgi:hypothetical protein